MPKVEAVYLMACETPGEIAANLPQFIDDVCNGKRPRSPFGYLNPAQFGATHTGYPAKPSV